jgi:uncharacterized protein
MGARRRFRWRSICPYTDDPLFLTFADPEHSLQEQRFIIMGESAKGQLLVVAYTERAGTTRLISARPVTRKERKVYESDL